MAFIPTTVPTAWFEANLSGIDWTTPVPVDVKFYARTPRLDTSNFSTYEALTDLDDHVEWVPCRSSVSAQTNTGAPIDLCLQSRTVAGAETLYLCDVDETARLVEDGCGWRFTAPTNPAEETITVAVFYLSGTDPYNGVVNPLLFATNQGIGDYTSMRGGELYGMSSSLSGIASGSEWVLGFAGFKIGSLLLVPQEPEWESAHTHHVWLEPQRTNLLVNPSLEAVDLNGWRTDGTVVRVNGGVDPVRPFCGQFDSGGGDALVIESNLFPVVGPWYSFGLNVAVLPADTGLTEVSYGLVVWDPGYTTSTFYCSDQYPKFRVVATSAMGGFLTLYFDPEEPLPTRRRSSDDRTYLQQRPTKAPLRVGQTLLVDGVSEVPDGVYNITAVPASNAVTIDFSHSDAAKTPDTGVATVKTQVTLGIGNATENYAHLTGVLRVPDDAKEMCLRIEATNCSSLWLDNALVDPHEGQYQYFDGSSRDSLPEDFRWVGGTSHQNRQFSVWYNNYKNTAQRLLSQYDDADGSYKMGMVEEWAPNGANIVLHWDAVTSFTPLYWKGDAFYPVNEVSGTPVNTLTAKKSFQYVDCPEDLL